MDAGGFKYAFCFTRRISKLTWVQPDRQCALDGIGRALVDASRCLLENEILPMDTGYTKWRKKRQNQLYEYPYQYSVDIHYYTWEVNTHQLQPDETTLA